MSLIDSKAAFRQRCGELSTASISLFDLLAAQSINCLSELAFSCGTPNRPPSDEECKALSDSVLGGNLQDRLVCLGVCTSRLPHWFCHI
jgi:hypothetical protein